MTASSPLQTIAVTFELSDVSLDKLRNAFGTIFYHPDNVVPAEEARKTEVWMTRYTGLPDAIKFEDLPKTKIVQLTSGTWQLLAHAKRFSFQPEPTSPSSTQRSSPQRRGSRLQSVVQVGSMSSPSPVTLLGRLSAVGRVSYLLTPVLANIHTSVFITRSEARWPRREELKYRPVEGQVTFGTQGFHTMRGKTAGLLGYGHIGRETARLLREFGVKIIAANSTGEKREDDGVGVGHSVLTAVHHPRNW